MKNIPIKILFFVSGLLLLISVIFMFSLSNNFLFTENSEEEKEMGNIVEDGEVVEDNNITLVAVGDIMLARGVEQKMVSYDNWNYSFLETYNLTSTADIAFGNLETTILEGRITENGSFFFRTDPQAVQGLQFAGFDVLSLANNHIMNFGRDGMLSTMERLDEAKIAHIGAGDSEEEIYESVIMDVKGIKFGFLAFSYSGERFLNGSGGSFGVADMDLDKMESHVKELSKDVDVVIVSMHSGIEYSSSPNAFQEEFARGAIDAGADLVIGHHPHVVQTVERYQEGYIIYSLGNFVFDQMWSEETRVGAIAKVTFSDDKIAEIEFIPTKIFDYCQPKFVEWEEVKGVASELAF